MKFKSLIVTTLVLVVFGSLVFVGGTGSSKPNQVSTKASQIGNQMPQGFGPFAVAITKNGEYAYLSFDLSEVIFKVRLADLSIDAMVDLSDYFPIECEVIALDYSEAKLFVYTPTWQKLIVIDTQTMSVIHTIDNINLVGLIRSQYGHFLIAPTGGGVNFVNTDTYEVTQFNDDGVFFVYVEESSFDQSKWYVVSIPPPWKTATVGIYDYKNKTWIFSVSISLHGQSEGIFDLEVLPNEQKLYIATLGGWYPEYHSYGWLYSIDLVGGNDLKVVPIDGGAMCLESSPDSKWLYLGTGWPIPNDNNLLVVNTQSDNVTGQIYLGTTKYGWHYTQMNKLQIDPANPNLLYATSSDANSLFKVNLDNLTLAEALVLNTESFGPRSFVKQPMQANGLVLIRQSANAFRFDPDNATITNMVEFPNARNVTGGYDIAIDDSGKLFIAQGEAILEVDAEKMSLLGDHHLPSGIWGVWSFILSNDQTNLYSIWPDPTQGNGYPDTFLAISTSTFQVEARVKLEGGNFNDKPYELPDSSKLYALGGMQNGPVVIQVIETNNYTIQKTITFDEPGLLGIASGSAYPFSYDPNSHTLFVGTTYVVLAIDTETDVIKKVIHLGDAATAIGLESWRLTYINAVGLFYNPQENCLYIAHADRSFISIYNLTNDQFLPLAIPLKGYGPSSLFASEDFSKIYCLMSRSDSASVIDVKSKVLEKVIDLHSSLPATTTMFSVQGNTKTYSVIVSSNSSVSMVNFNLSSKQISFKAMGASFGFPFPIFCNVTFPNELLWGNLTLQMDGNIITESIRKDNGTHTSFYFNYELQGAKNVQVTGTETLTPSLTPTPIPTLNLTPTPTPALTLAPTSTPSATPTVTSVPTSTPSPTSTTSPSQTINSSPTSSLSPTPSIPEFPSWIILPALLLIATLATVAIKKKGD